MPGQLDARRGTGSAGCPSSAGTRPGVPSTPGPWPGGQPLVCQSPSVVCRHQLSTAAWANTMSWLMPHLQAAQRRISAVVPVKSPLIAGHDQLVRLRGVAAEEVLLTCWPLVLLTGGSRPCSRRAAGPAPTWRTARRTAGRIPAAACGRTRAPWPCWGRGLSATATRTTRTRPPRSRRASRPRGAECRGDSPACRAVPRSCAGRAAQGSHDPHVLQPADGVKYTRVVPRSPGAADPEDALDPLPAGPGYGSRTILPRTWPCARRR